MVNKLVKLTVVILTSAACAGCSVYPGYDSEYLNALELSSPTQKPDIEAFKTRFTRLFNHLQEKDLEHHVMDLYSESFYFNDTFHTFIDRSSLTEYLRRTGENLKYMEVSIQDVSVTNGEVYVRWVMKIQFESLAKGKEQRSIGMSHIRLNADGKIILHQDFWDGVAGFYGFIPILGQIIHGIRESI